MGYSTLEALVRVKKRDGLAEFSEKCLRWTPSISTTGLSIDNTNQLQPIIVQWSNVLDQQVSSFTSPKAMIRLKMTNNATLVLEFLSDKSLDHAFSIREQAKHIITQCITENGKKKASQAVDRTPLCNLAEIKQRAALLAANPTLKRQHTEMVNEGLISEEDFWASRRNLIVDEAAKRQKTGKTSAILTDLTGDHASGGNVVKYNLNAEVIHQIFVQYPGVHLAYTEQVPDKMSETEFWGTFFKSKYFHRDRRAAGHEDLFTKYEEQEQALASKNVVDPRGVVDPLVDLTATSEDRPERLTIRVLRDPNTSSIDTGPGAKLSSGLTGPSSGAAAIAKINRHAAYVLDPVHALQKLHGKEQEILKSTVASSHQANSHHDSAKEATLLDDLRIPVPVPYSALTLENESQYFRHKNTEDSNNGSASKSSQEYLQNVQGQWQAACQIGAHSIKTIYPSWQTTVNVMHEIMNAAEAQNSEHLGNSVNALNSVQNSNFVANGAELIPQAFRQQVFNQFHDVNELLRHFLSFKKKVADCPTDVAAKLKLGKIVDKMSSKYDELAKIREALPPHEKNLLAPLLKPFDDQLNLAFI